MHETLGTYRVRPGLLHGVLFDFRSEPQNRKLAIFPIDQVKSYTPQKFHANRFTRLGGDRFTHIKNRILKRYAKEKAKVSNFVLFRINNLQSRWSRDKIRSGDRREQCHVMVRQVTKDCRDQN